MNFKCLPEPDFSQVTVGSEPQPFAGVGGGRWRRGGEGGRSPAALVMSLLAFAYLASSRSRILEPAHRSNFSVLSLYFLSGESEILLYGKKLWKENLMPKMLHIVLEERDSG